MEHHKNLSLLDIEINDLGIIYKEEWRDVRGYEGLYKVSSFGRVKSPTKITTNRNGPVTLKERIIKQSFLGKYLGVGLIKNYKQKSYRTHTLVWDAFGDKSRNGKVIQVDHINDNKIDNRAINLQVLSHRDNNIKKHSGSKYMTGVSARGKSFRSSIFINGKSKGLGTFKTEKDAHAAYLKAKNIYENSFN